MKIQPEPQPDFATRTFVMTLSGHELAHLWRVSYNEEGGDKYPGGLGSDRIFRKVTQALNHADRQDLDAYVGETDFSKGGPGA